MTDASAGPAAPPDRPAGRAAAMTRALRHQVIIVVLLLLTIVGSLWQYFAAEATSRSLIPLNAAVATIGHDIAEFHIWLEEALQGDELLTREAVMARIDGVAARIAAVLAGEAINGVDLPEITDGEMIAALTQLNDRVDALRDLADRRFDMGDAGVSGSEIDQVFDEYYYITTRAYRRVSSELETLIQENLGRVSNISLILIVLSISVKLAIILMMIFMQRSFQSTASRLEQEVNKSIEYIQYKEKNRKEKMTLLAMLNHELRTPLNAIKGFSEIMKSEQIGKMPPKYREYAEHIYDSADRFLCVADTLMDLSKIETQSDVDWRDTIDLRQISQQIASMMKGRAEEGGVTVVLDVAPTCSALVADRKLVGDILANLLHNAIKFTPAGGEVRVTCRGDRDHAVLLVEDTGIGMSPREVAQATQPFSPSTPSLVGGEQGAGLGLAVAKLATERLGGAFSLTSEQDVGTRVEVSLPRREE